MRSLSGSETGVWEPLPPAAYESMRTVRNHDVSASVGEGAADGTGDSGWAVADALASSLLTLIVPIVDTYPVASTNRSRRGRTTFLLQEQATPDRPETAPQAAKARAFHQIPPYSGAPQCWGY